MTIVKILGSVFLVFALTFCAHAQDQTEDTLLSHCNYYTSNKSISDILTGADRGYVLHLTDSSSAPSSSDAPYSILAFGGYDLFSGKDGASLSLRVVVAQDQSAIIERRSYHNDVSFLMDYVDNPPSYGYWGESLQHCNIIPVVQPGVKYWVFFDDGRISMFEPVSRASRLNQWIAYFIKSRYGVKLQN